MAKRSYPTSEVRCSAREYQTVTVQERPKGATPLQGRQPGGATPRHKPEAKGSSGEEQPHFQGAEAAWAQEGLEELSHTEGQEGRR